MKKTMGIIELFLDVDSDSAKIQSIKRVV